MARSARGRTRNLSLGPLVQHKPPSPRPGRNHTATSRKQTHNNTKESGLKIPTQNPGLDNPDNRHKHGGTAPDKGHYTRYVAVHPNRRGALPTDRVQRPNTQEQTRNWHTEPLTATPLHAQLGPTGGRMSTPPTPPTPPPALRPNPTPPTPLHAKSPITYPHTPAHKRDRWRRLHAATRRPARPRIRRSTSLRPAALSLMNLRSTK